MSALEFVTVTVSSIAIGASVVAILLFVLLTMLQKKLIIHTGKDTKVDEETAWTLQLFGESLKDDIPDNDREVLANIIVRYSEASLTSVLDDATERVYLLEGLSNPSRLPWEKAAEQRQAQPRK
ncbi:MAG: hypothetical protein QUS33_03500 [Dehalococcoidia bacterium]|nr:hypothetical protein [Dehalococcoidia bacterium]